MVLSGHVPVRRLAGGEGLGGGKVEELEPHLWVVVWGLGMAGGRLAAGAGGRRRCSAAAAAFRRGVEVPAGPVSFTKRLGRYWGTRFGPWESGWAAPRRAGARRLLTHLRAPIYVPQAHGSW